MITGERGIKKKLALNSNLKMITGERGIKKGKYPAEPVTGSNHKKTQAHKQHNQDRRYNIQK